MVDFLLISTRTAKRGMIEIFPKFVIKKSSDLMIRGRDFYAIWLDDSKTWSTDEQDALQLIDNELDRFAAENAPKFADSTVRVMHMWDADSGMIDNWHKYCQKQMRDSYHTLDEKLIFLNDDLSKKDYASRKLNYPLEPCDISNYDKLMSVLYAPEEREKLEWAIGSIINGDSKKIQKFMVLYGAAGTGKSTVLNIIQKLFDGYYSVFDAKALGSSSNSFALEAFKTNPLVAIQHDGDLSHIEDNTRLNSLVSHEYMTVNEKFKATYTNKFKCFLFMGTNKPVKITDAKSGLIRRLIDVSPTGEKIPASEYRKLIKAIDFELGGIALHCKDIYESDPGKYDDYIPVNMMGASNDFYNFVLDSYFTFKDQDEVGMKQAWEMYKTYCDDAKVPYPMSQRIFKEELKNYFDTYEDRTYSSDGERVRSYYKGFKIDKFKKQETKKKVSVKNAPGIIFEEQPSYLDNMCKDMPAQYANDEGTPYKKWSNVTTVLKDIDSKKLHYLKLPENHIVIDFDIPNEKGEKDFKLNLEEASKWPPTYAELSKSGAGIHLHYIYAGNPSKLSRLYDDKIEIKVFTGDSSLRRKLTKCNDIPVATINSGLPLKGEKKMINSAVISNEQEIRGKIKSCLNKKCGNVPPFTITNISFIKKILDDAYDSGMHYDVFDMRDAIQTFAAHSTHQAKKCIETVALMHFRSEDCAEPVIDITKPLAFFDCEVFPNYTLICWKYAEDYGPDNFESWNDYVKELFTNHKPVMCIRDPKPEDIEPLLNLRLVGFNNRNYDNHIVYGRLMGYADQATFKQSDDIINKHRNEAKFNEAINMSYTDIYDYSSKKQSLKKWEIELGLPHKECDIPWDQDVKESEKDNIDQYCINDVLSTEAVWHATQPDFLAREILADIAGLSVNDTTNRLTTKIIFGKERKPRLVYTNLATGEQE